MLLLIKSLILLTGIYFSPPQNPAIKVNVRNVSSKKGEILLALYNNADGFPGKSTNAYRTAKGVAANGKCTIILENIEPGTYAVALFHDTNNDGKLNYNFLGIPKEGYGVSNNVKNTFSAPSFKQASFTHQGETTITISINY